MSETPAHTETHSAPQRIHSESYYPCPFGVFSTVNLGVSELFSLLQPNTREEQFKGVVDSFWLVVLNVSARYGERFASPA